jgi:carbohydrate-selective porin OprB
LQWLRLGGCSKFFSGCAASHCLPIPRTPGRKTPSGGDSHEISRPDTRYLFGDWGGERSRLEELGVVFDLHYISDSLWNLKNEQPGRAAVFNRVRGTVDIDLGRLTRHEGWYFRATFIPG